MATGTNDISCGYVFQWKIENISHCWWLRMPDAIESPTFTADELESTKWSLSFFPMSYPDKRYVGVYLNREEDSGIPIAIEVFYKMAFLGKDGSMLNEGPQVKHTFKEKVMLGFAEYQERETVFITEREKYLPEDTLTVQCTICRHDQTLNKPKYMHARTIFRAKRRTLEWKIAKISTLGSQCRKRYKNDTISFDLVFNEKSTDVLKFDKISFDDSLKYFSCNASVVDSLGKKEHCGIVECLQRDLSEKALAFELRFPSKLWEDCRYLPNDVLTLEFVFTTIERRYCFQKNPVEFEYEPCIGKETFLTNDLKSMFRDKIFTDVVIRTQNREFPAHKAVLSARSPVFQKMFNTRMSESNSGCVEIIDFEIDTVHRMLLYMYTDCLEDLESESAKELYKMADKYDIQSLKSNCSYFLMESLHPTNACGILVLADTYNDIYLKSAAQNYLMSRSQIFHSQEWTDFMNTHLKLAANVMRKKLCPVGCTQHDVL